MIRSIVTLTMKTKNWTWAKVWDEHDKHLLADGVLAFSTISVCFFVLVFVVFFVCLLFFFFKF